MVRAAQASPDSVLRSGARMVIFKSRNQLQKATRRKVTMLYILGQPLAPDVLHPESKQQTTPASPRDALECVAALARTRECRQNCVRFAYRGPQVDRLHVLELKRDVE